MFGSLIMEIFECKILPPNDVLKRLFFQALTEHEQVSNILLHSPLYILSGPTLFFTKSVYLLPFP